jgi:CRP/FNR family transcriptional regulator, cyclic AMP receptor protein
MRKALHLLGILEDSDIEWMIANGTLHQVDTDSVLIQEKNPIGSIYILLEGELSVIVGGRDGKHIATLMPGEVVGEISFVDSRPPSASVLATRDSRVLALSTNVLSAKLAVDTAFAARFYYAVATFLADRLYVTVGRYGYGSARQDTDVDEVSDSALDKIDIAAVRFDQLLKRLRVDYSGRSDAASND